MTRKSTSPPSDQPDPVEHFATLAQELQLTALRDEFPALLAQAEKGELSYSSFAVGLLLHELIARESRRLTRNLKRSGLPSNVEGLDGFDFSLRPKLTARAVHELLNCRWVTDGGRNVLCVGRPGLGKTRVLEALGHAACHHGYSVLKVHTAEMLEDLQGSVVDHSYSKTFRHYEKPSVLLLDDFGYEEFDRRATQQLFRLISARHRRKSIVLAASTGFQHWKDLFPSEAQAVAIVDRLIDRATILRFTGKSCRKPNEELGEDAAD